MAHARQLLSVERATGLSIEHALQAAALQLPWLAGIANVCYTATHLIAPPIVLVFLYRKAPARYRQWRNVFLVMLGLSLLVFLLYPVLPPRLVPGAQHVTDTSRTYFNVDRVPGAALVATPTRSSSPDWAPFTNPMAAMPSLHVGWAVWAAAALWSVTRRRWLRWLLVAYPLVMVWAVIVTGNHWVLDAVGGVMVVAAAYFVSGLISRARPDHAESNVTRSAVSTP
jgi:membrane-associated phospholipid phosphatase